MDEDFRFRVIGYVRSPFLYKNGTPRQPTICREITGEITVLKNVFNNPEHSLEGLEEFSHVWIFFIFHKNNNDHAKAKVKPPRLNGKKTGVFSTRSPYRPNNIGLTLAKIESVKGATITVSGIDILDGSPVIDLKPYIPAYDNPDFGSEDLNEKQTEEGEDIEIKMKEESENQYLGVGTKHRLDEMFECQYEQIKTNNQKDLSSIQSKSVEICEGAVANFEDFTSNDKDIELATCTSETEKKHANHRPTLNEKSELGKDRTPDKSINLPETKHPEACVMKDTSCKRCTTADWISNSPIKQLEVRFTHSAEKQLRLFSTTSSDPDFKFQFLKSYSQAKQAIEDILHEDPRSTYRRNHCADSLYFFTLDIVHVTCWFDENLVEIVRIKPSGKVEKLKKSGI